MKHPGIPHNPNDPVIDPETGQPCFGCRVGSGTGELFALGAGTQPTRKLDRPHVNRPMNEPSWEKGVAGEHRPGGGFVPYTAEDGHEIGIKEFGERRGELTEARRRLHNDPHVYTP